MMERGRRAWGGLLPLLAIHIANEFYRIDRKPPVTAALLAANVLTFLRPLPLIPSIDHVCFNPHLILKYMDLKRFFLSPFYHIDEPHLFYNMMSLLWKGIQLESSMGNAKFLSMIATLLATSQAITMILAGSLCLFFDYQQAYYYDYSVGFSGVLFAMKVVLNSQSDNYTSVHGLTVPARHAAWAELIIIQILVPGVSFLGHLGGILAGLLYLRLGRSYTGSDPLAIIIKGLIGAFFWPLRFVRNKFGFQRSRTYGRGTVGGAGEWRCQACTYDNAGWFRVCDVCGTSRRSSGVSSHQFSHRSWDQDRDLALEELRLRRVERFGR